MLEVICFVRKIVLFYEMFSDSGSQQILIWFTINVKAHFVAANRALNFMSYGGAEGTFGG